MSSKYTSSYPYLSINGEFYDKEFLDKLWSYFHQQALLWKMGLDVPSPSDKFAYHVLNQISTNPCGNKDHGKSFEDLGIGL